MRVLESDGWLYWRAETGKLEKTTKPRLPDGARVYYVSPTGMFLKYEIA